LPVGEASAFLKIWDCPLPADIKPRVNDFLQQLAGPTAIHVAGVDGSRCRVLVTLSHGNEPSGLEAVHRWLLKGEPPAVNIVIVLGAVATALLEPMFYFRQPPGLRDLNRCFSPPFNDDQGQLAQAILNHIRAARPEAVIDLHNTSGSSPAFAVTVGDSREQRSLVSFFVHHLMVTDLKLGSIMEQDLGCPVVTIEAGGSLDESAERVASGGIERYFNAVDVLNSQGKLELLHHPLRLELCEHSRIDYAERALHDRDITVRADIEKFNDAPLREVDMIGWLEPDGLSHLRVGSDVGHPHRVADYFKVEEGKLYPLQDMRLFMATTRGDIAASDCLFYFVIEE
jgi:hypothetical protein